MSKLLKIGFVIVFFILTLVFLSCEEDSIPKPEAQLRLEYQKPEYSNINSNCLYTFQVSNQAKAFVTDKCWVNIVYPNLKATVNITYRTVDNNLKELFLESEKLTFNHAIKADEISSTPFVNSVNKTYGAIYEVTGNAASPVQFHLTDSTKHFITGALYFEVQPNYDSILPAIQYVEKDLKHLMESLKWKN
ncbi:MAG: gliding motility lipoprotein GldD [Bacteroidota bacterium]